jgi:hypothetical protein
VLSDSKYDRRLPSADELRKIAGQRKIDFDDLMARTDRAGEDAERHLKRNPELGILFRRIPEHGLRGAAIDEFIKEADRLGREGRR